MATAARSRWISMKPWPSSEGQALLTDVLDKGDLVAFRRRFRRADLIQGYVIGLGPVWVIVRRFHSDSAPLGICALRLADITAIRPYAPEEFLKRACDALGYGPDLSPGLDPHSDTRLVSSLGRTFPLITVFNEDDDPQICSIGAVTQASGGRLRLREIGTDAKWDDVDTSYKTREITRVDVDGPYERALVAIARADG